MGRLAEAITPATNKSVKPESYQSPGFARRNDYGINVWGKCVFAPSVTEAIKVIQNRQQEVTGGGN